MDERADTDDDLAWPSALALPVWARALTWRSAPTDVEGARDPRTLAPLSRVCPHDPVLLQGQPLAATLTFELERLVRVELRGPLDALAGIALGASGDNTDDPGHHRFERGATRVEIDLVEGLVALEPLVDVDLDR